MADTIYHNIFKEMLSKTVDFHLNGDSFKLALFTSSKVINADDVNYSTTNEIATAAPYSAGGYAFDHANSTVTDYGTPNFDTIFDINEDASWAVATITAAYAQLYDSTVSNRLVCIFDFGGNKSSTAGTFKVVFNASGVLKLA